MNMSNTSTTLDTIKGLLGKLNDDEMDSLLCEIAFKHNVGIPAWYTVSTVREMSEKVSNDTELDNDDIGCIIDKINKTDTTIVDTIPYTHIKIYIAENKNDDDVSEGEEDDNEN